ncbi:MAG: hypothetical protein J6K42_02285 [Clostridia bacterium]|nr:hypothetical protein [Clostridia bacterium]
MEIFTRKCNRNRQNKYNVRLSEKGPENRGRRILRSPKFKNQEKIFTFNLLMI